MRWAVIAASLSLLTGTNIAVAADLPQAPPPQAAAAFIPPPPPVYNWSGFYLGVNAGYGFASASAGAITTSGNAFGLNGTATGTGNNDINGFLVGGTVGANFQSGQFVFGVEGDWNWADQSETQSLGCGVGCTINGTGKIEWLATFRGRFGYAFDRVLVYGTAGGAVMDGSDTITASAGGISATLLSASDTAFGWTAGGGVEVGLTENVTARAEYLFVSAKPTLTATIPAAIGGGTVTDTTTINDNIIRAGLDFKFGGF